MKLTASRYEKAFYIDSQAESGNVISNSVVIWDFKGALNPEVLQQAIVYSLSHPCFHFQYTLQSDQLFKEPFRNTPEIPYFDLSQEHSPEYRFQCLLDEYYQNKLNFNHEPLFKICVCKMAKDRFKAIVMLHHICMDGSGFRIFFDHTKQAYDTLIQGTCLPLIKVPPFDQALALSDMAKAEAFELWGNSLAGHSARVDFNHAINPEKRRAIGERLSLGIQLTQRVKVFCRQQGLTPNILFKGLYALLISRMANQKVIAICSPMDRRTKPMKQQMGCFVNTRLDVFNLDKADTLSEYWSQIKKFNKETKSYGELPYAELVHYLKQQSENSESMLCNVVFGSTIGIDDESEFGSECLVNQNYTFIELNSDLQLLFSESSDNSFHFRFDFLQSFEECGLFSHFLKRFSRLLEWVIEQDDSPIMTIPFLTKRESILFNQPTQSYPDQNLAQLVHHWVQHTPTSLALIDGENNKEISFQQLHRKVSDLAYYIAQLEQRVKDSKPCIAINLDSLVDTVVAILATQYRGLPFTCVDGNAPLARKQMVMAQISPLLLIGDAISSEQETHYHHLPSLAELPHSQNLAEPANTASGNISQYIFTSGTTGQPKAVSLSHRALVSTLHNSSVLPIGKRMLYSANEAFDAATLQLWLTLIHGRTLVVPRRNDIANPEIMASLLRTYQIDHLFLTTGLFETYMSSSKREIFNHIDTLLFGGDSVSKQAVARGLQCNIKNLINMYGPTEASIFVTTHRCTENDLAASIIPIGKPRPNSHTWIVDDQNRLLGFGMVGHIVISGDGLAEGYLGQPAQNDKFCQAHLFESGIELSQRVYRTGDHGYWREDGALVFCGRKDEQIKLRGYRIELAEIRQAIEQIADVKMAVVVLSEKAKFKQLLGYYQADQRLDHQQMLQELQHRLPSYMLPSQLIHLKELPLNRNGKLDRQALPEPEVAVAEKRELTPLQQTLLEQAAKVLELPSLDLFDDFVAQGGDSISAILLSVGLEEQGIRLSTADIMKYRRFAELIHHMSVPEDAQIILGEKQGRFGLLPAQRWFFEQKFSEPSHFNQAVSLRLLQDIDDTRMASALTQLTQYHDSFWLRFDNTQQQFLSKPTKNHFELQRVSVKNWQEAEEHVKAINASFDLHHGPLLKALLLSIDSETSPYLYLCAHHLIVDGVSWRRIVADLQGYYEQGSTFKPTPYSNTQCYQTQWQAFESDPKELNYWLNHVTTKNDLIDRPKSTSIQSRQISISPQQTQALLSHANQPYGTQVNELLITVLYKVFSTPSYGLNLLLEGHGRKMFTETVRSEATVGWFTSIFPAYLPAINESWPALIKQTKQTLRSLPAMGENFLSIAYNHPDPAIRNHLQAMLRLPISFNFLGRFGHSNEDNWHIEHRFIQHLVSKANKPLRDMDINAWVSDNQLHVNFELAGHHFADMTLEQICRNFSDALGELLEHCCDPQCKGGLTPSDLIDIKLEQATIESLEQQVGPLENIYPTTDVQRELLYFNRVNADYQIDQLFFRLEGELNQQAFAEAWSRTLAKYDILRAGFDDSSTPGQPLALIPCRVTLPLQYVNWEGLNDEALLQEAIINERKGPFDWHNPPLLRLMLARLSTQHHVLLFTFHHVLFDGWSMQIFLKETMHDYERLVKGESLSFQQHSFSAFPRWLNAQDSAPATSYWKEYLAGAQMNMRIMSDNPPQMSNSLRMQPAKGGLDRDNSERLREFAIHTGATLNQLCQLSWAATLAKYTNNRDVVFGTTLTKRPVEINKVTELVGLFVAAPPLRVQLGGDICDLVQQLNDNSEQRVNYAFCDLNHYDKQWRPTAPFGTLFVFENYPEQKAKSEQSLSYNHMGTVSGTNHQIVFCQFPGEELTFTLFYDSTELSSELAARIANDYRDILLKLASTRQSPERLIL